MHAKTTVDIARFVCDTGFDQIPGEVIAYARILALSHLGANLAGSAMDCGRLVNDYVRSKGSLGRAGVYGAGYRSSADHAALANGNAAHSTELEDDSYPEIMYSCGHWPTAFAMAEATHASGRQLIEALVIGYEVGAKLGLAYLDAALKGKASFAALSAIANAATAAKLLRLDERQTTCALSIAASQAAGLRRQAGSGAHLVEAGFTGRNGICAAELASLGYTGNMTILEGKGGFGDFWSGHTEFDLPLGEDWRILRVGIKKYSSCYGSQRNIDGVLDLIAEHRIAWDDVLYVEHEVNITAANTLKYPQPETEDQTRFSYPHCTVACFFDRKVSLDSFTDSKALDPRWREARAKVRVTVHPEWPQGSNDCYDSPVHIVMKDGRRFSKLCHRARGDPDCQRFGIPEVRQKYLECMEYAACYSPQRIEQIADLALNLDRLNNLSVLAGYLTYPDREHRSGT